MSNDIQVIGSAVTVIKTAILQSQARAVKAVNEEQLALYYGIGRFVSANTRNKNWGKGIIEQISERLRKELPGLRGFGASSLKNMRLFYEAWSSLECNSPIAIGELEDKADTIRQLQLTNYPDFPLAEFLSISFTHHIRILENAKDLDERIFYIRYCHNYKPAAEDVRSIIHKQDLYHHQANLPNNFLATIPDYKQAFRAIQMFKDEYLLDFVNVEELGMHEEEIDERVIEQNIVHRVKNFIMTFGNHNDDDRREGENPPIGIILCKNMDKEYVNYIMQDFRQPMGVATYKTADEVDPELVKLLPPKEELLKLIDGHPDNN